MCVWRYVSLFTHVIQAYACLCAYTHMQVGGYVWRDGHVHTRRCVHVYRCECPPELGACVRVHA